MWGKTLAFVILFILAFGILVAWIPDDFIPGGVSAQDADALTALNAANLIVYSTVGADNMTQGYSSFNDGPTAPDWNVSLPEGEYLEVWWGQNPVYGQWVIELKHIGTAWWGGPSAIDTCLVKNLDGDYISPTYVWAYRTGIIRQNLEDAWDSDTNSSAFTAACDHVAVSIIFKPDGGYTDIGEAFDAGYLWYGLSYDWNADDTGFNVMSLILKLLTFQGIGVGVPGAFGALIDALISSLFYIAIAVVAYVVITAIIPFVGGAPDT